MPSSSQDLFSTSSIQKDAFFVRDWGMATFVEGGTVDPKDRVLHVGIDYTQYVTEDGTELKTKEYGVHDKETFEGYEFVETRTAENGDTVHVYKKVVTPDPTPEPENPTTPANPVEETPAVPTPTPEPEAPITPADPTPTTPVEDQPVVPAEPTPEQPDTPVTPEEPSSPTENTGESATPEDTGSKLTTETQNSNENTTEETKSSKNGIIETGARTNMFLSLSMAVIALFAGLFILNKKKN